MISIFISSLLGTFALHVVTIEDSWKTVVTVVPPGPTIYIGESVLLQCTVQSNSTFARSYLWYRDKARTALTPTPRHLVSGDSYSITAVTREDAGVYWCEPEPRGRNATTVSALLTVSEFPLSSLHLTPSSRTVFKGERFTVECPPPQPDATGWRLKHAALGHTEGATVNETEQCSPHGGAARAGKSDMCSFEAASGNSGLYWCENTEGRSRAVSVTVSYDDMILKTPVFPVFEGNEVVLYCQSLRNKHDKMKFFKNGAEITSSNTSSSDTVAELNIVNVRRRDEGFYKCTSEDGKTQSQESWLAVRPRRGNLTSTQWTEEPTSGSLKWILLSCVVVLLCASLLITWLIFCRRKRMFFTRSCWPLSEENIPAVPLPATKQDVTEVQWDLSWMEMSSLLDKPLHPGT